MKFCELLQNKGTLNNHNIIGSRTANFMMSNHLEKTFIEKNIRGWKRPSDHVPVVADFKFN